MSFVKKAKHRLKRNLLRTPVPLYFKNFQLTLPTFVQMLENILASQPGLSHLAQLAIPRMVLEEIGSFAVFSRPLTNIMPNQEVYIEECQDSDVVIAAPKFNHLRLRRCSNMTVSFLFL